MSSRLHRSLRIAAAALTLAGAFGCDSSPDPELDAGPTPSDAGADAGSPPGDAGADAGDVEVGPAHCLHDNLQIAGVDPGTSVTIFNPTSDTIAIDDFNYVLCQKPSYPTLTTLEPGVVLAPGESHAFPWPFNFDQNDDAGGEVALYSFPSFTNPTSQIDFVCWGTGIPDSRKSVAEQDGDWVGPCAPAITGESLVRVPQSDGHGAASYDATGAAAALSCP